MRYSLCRCEETEARLKKNLTKVQVIVLLYRDEQAGDHTRSGQRPKLIDEKK